MAKALKVLSIDFDFFQKTTVNLLMNYPDGVDLPTKITEITWSSHYSYNYDELMAIKIDESKLKQLYKILSKQDNNIPVMIVQSHKHIYDFILRNRKDNAKIQVYNIDMHHDCFGDKNRSIDCGNWVLHLKKDFPNTEITWITQKEGLELYNNPYNIPTEFTFDKIRDKKFDMIFLCRSDTWLPQHLDGYFEVLTSFLLTNFTKVQGERTVLASRNWDNIYKQVQMQRQFMNEMRKNLKQ